VTAMAMYQSQVVAFARYATAQTAYWQRILALHEVDGTGCCRFCGRAWPCDDLRHSQQMVEHFSQWALPDDASRLLPDADLVRPYVDPATNG
jgi:hypothetical protein